MRISDWSSDVCSSDLPQGKKSGLDYIAYKGFACHVEAEEGRLWIVKQTGSQRPSGRIWPERDDRQIFLGAMELGDEKEPPAYGDDPDRSEEHTSELQSLMRISYAVFCLKKKKKNTTHTR